MGGPLLISIHCDPGVVKGSFPVLQRINESLSSTLWDGVHIIGM